MEIIRRNIADKQHETLDGRHVTISIGLQKLLPNMSKEVLFYKADSALYTAKRSGKNRTCLLDSETANEEEPLEVSTPN